MKNTKFKQLAEEFIKKIFVQYRDAIIEVKDKEKEKWDAFDWESATNFLLGDLEKDILKFLDKREDKERIKIKQPSCPIHTGNLPATGWPNDKCSCTPQPDTTLIPKNLKGDYKALSSVSQPSIEKLKCECIKAGSTTDTGGCIIHNVRAEVKALRIIIELIRDRNKEPN